MLQRQRMLFVRLVVCRLRSRYRVLLHVLLLHHKRILRRVDILALLSLTDDEAVHQRNHKTHP
jgi:hypothetical protein